MNEDDKFDKFFKMLGIDWAKDKEDNTKYTSTTDTSKINSSTINNWNDSIIKDHMDNIKKKYEEEIKNEMKSYEHPKSNYTIVSGIQKVYHDLLLTYKGDIDRVINEALDEVLIDTECSKPYIVHNSHPFDTRDYYINSMLSKNGSVSSMPQVHTYQTGNTIGSHTHNINTNYNTGFTWHTGTHGIPSYPYNTQQDSDFINIKEYKFINNENIVEYLIETGNWEYAGVQTQQRMILEKIPDKYKYKKDIHDIEFCVEFIEQHPEERIIAETHPSIIQTKEFQKQIKLLKLKDKYIPSE